MDAQNTIRQAFKQAIREYHASRLRQAAELCEKILLLEPDHAGSMHLSGMVALGENRIDDAVDWLHQAISIDDKAPQFFASLGEIMLKGGRYSQALDALKRAIELRSDLADVWYNLGLAYRNNGQTEQAVEAYRKAIELNPNFAQAFNNIGNAMRQKYQLEEAAEAYSKALALKPDHIEARNNFSVTMKDLGRLDEAIECFHQTLGFDPNYFAVHSNLVYALHFHPDSTDQSLAQAHQDWNQRHAIHFAANAERHENDCAPDRRLRIGYVSPDFREHCQSLFTIPLLSNHTHGACEIFIYSDVRKADATTEKIKAFADVWRDTVDLNDEQLAKLIRSDRIDILIDLTMHMARNRLLVFARKPAPLAVTWLAYPSTTGLTAIDYRLTDPYLDPPGMDETCYSEKSFRLPDTFWCYDPAAQLDVNDLPAKGNGYVTFGCLNNFCKINPAVLQAWSHVLKAVPNSKLRLLAPFGRCRDSILEILNIEPARIEFEPFRPRAEYLKLYHTIDLCLDTFPYNGHTTSLDALWMGVPVVSLCGKTPVSRAGFSQMSNLGLTELVGQTPDEFVRIAIDLANDLSRLDELRKSLRERMVHSPLMDAPRFARNIENAYRMMWTDLCNATARL